MKDGRVRSGLKKGMKFTNPIMSFQLNTRAADNNTCNHCGQIIKEVFSKGVRVRDNRIDCEEDNGKLVSYHLTCYDIEVLDNVRVTTFAKLWEIEK